MSEKAYKTDIENFHGFPGPCGLPITNLYHAFRMYVRLSAEADTDCIVHGEA